MAKKVDAISEKKAGEILAQVKAHYKEMEEAVERRSSVWLSCLEAFRGATWQTKAGLDTGDVDVDDEIRVSLNHIKRLVRAATNQRVKNAPSPRVPPATNETTDLAKASAAERLLHSTLERRGAIGAALEATLWANITSAGFVKTWWNPHVGRRIEQPDYGPVGQIDPLGSTPDLKDATAENPRTDPEERRVDDMPGGLSAVVPPPPMDEFGEPIDSAEFEGDLCYTFVDSYSLLIDSNASSWADVRRVIHRRPMPLEEIVDLHPTDVLGRPTKELLSQAQAESTSRTPTSRATDVYGGGVQKDVPEMCEEWEAPSEKYQNGRMIQWCGNALLWYGPCPYRPARLPFAPALGEGIVPGTFYPDGMVRDLIPAQKVHNYFASKAAEWVREILNPAWLNPEQGEIDDSQVSDKFGKILTYTYPYKPEFMNVPDIPASVPTMMSFFENEMQTMSGVSPLATGETPPGADSGRAMALLGEKDATFRFIDYNAYAMFWKELCRQSLMLMHQFYEEGRLVRLLGRNSQWEIIAFRREDFSATFDVEIEPFSPEQSGPTRDARLTEAFERGIMGNVQDPAVQKQVREAMQLDRAGSQPYNDEELDRANARREQLLFLQFDIMGMPPPPDPNDMMADNQEIFIEEGARFRKTDEFRMLNPVAKTEFVTRIGIREQILQQQNATMASQMNPGAGPAQTPGSQSSSAPNQEGLVGNPNSPSAGGGLPTDARFPSPLEASAGHELDIDVANVHRFAHAVASGTNGSGR